MSLIEFSLVKKHLRAYHDDEDTEIAAYQAAAEAMVVNDLDRVVLEVGESASSGDDGTAIEVNPPIVAAILLQTEHLYKFRGADDADVPPAPASIMRLIAPYRVWRTFDECAAVVTQQ